MCVCFCVGWGGGGALGHWMETYCSIGMLTLKMAPVTWPLGGGGGGWGGGI